MNNLSQIDLSTFFHPCSQMSEYSLKPPIIIDRAKGLYYYDINGKKYVDGISSWWVNILGHCEPRIADSIADQAKKLEHGILAGFSNEPIIKLSQRLVEITPANLNKCFYGDNGSSAVEIALKLAFQGSSILGRNRKKFLCLKNGYHGETLGALGVSDVGIYKDVFSNIISEPIVALAPSATISDDFAISEFEKILNKHSDEICAFIVEPLLQCAGGMNMYSAKFLEFAVRECKKRDIFVIFDEIATGFCRTGKMFALEYLADDCMPDMLCLSKGITGGFLPLSVVLMSDEIYNIFYAPYGIGRDFLHSHSYAGNTLACIAANTVLDIFKSDNIVTRVNDLSCFLKSAWSEIATIDGVSNVRCLGMVGAFEFEMPKNLTQRFSIDFFWRCIDHGVFLRPLGNTIYFMPPYCISKNEINFVVDVVKKVLKSYF